MGNANSVPEDNLPNDTNNTSSNSNDSNNTDHGAPLPTVEPESIHRREQERRQHRRAAASHREQTSESTLRRLPQPQTELPSQIIPWQDDEPEEIIILRPRFGPRNRTISSFPLAPTPTTPDAAMLLVLNPDLPNFEQRLENGRRMFHHIQWLNSVGIPRFADEMREMFALPRTTSNRRRGLCPFELQAQNTFSRFLRLGANEPDDSNNLPFEVLPGFDGIQLRLHGAVDFIARFRFLRRSFRVLESVMRNTLLPQNSPWTLTFQPLEAIPFRNFLNHYGGFLRIGTRHPAAVLANDINLRQLGTSPHPPPSFIPVAFRDDWDDLRQVFWLEDNALVEQYVYGIDPSNLPEVAPSQAPASSNAIASLPQTPYVEVEHHSNICGEKCTICSTEFDTDRFAITPLPCGHFFHSQCIVMWLWHRGTCPICRAVLQ